MQKYIKKDDFKEFLKKFSKNYDIIAPVKNKNSRFQKINDVNEIFLENITDVPAKKLFIPENEVLVEYKNGILSENKGVIKKRIIFGLRLCDLNALEILDKVMPCPLFINKRKNTVLIGLYCIKPDKYCFCNSMSLNDKCYDLFFYPKDDKYIIDVRSKKGKELTKDLPKLKKEIKIPKPVNAKILKNKDIDRFYKNKIWESDADKCLSCSACTIYCPTCNCFDIKDELDINLKDGKRFRHEMSCQLKSFSRVAGGKVFRDSRLSRFKHFVYHKIVYYKKQKDRYMCVGCGRCLRVCPPKIDWVDTINLLKDEERIKSKIKKKEKMTIYKFNRYNKKYPKLFEREKNRLLKILLKKTKIEHIGSTSVPTLGGKKVIDIIIGVKKNKIRYYKNLLIKKKYRFVETLDGRHFFTKNRGLLINNRYHIHLTEYNNKIWKQAIKFKNALEKNKKLRDKYTKIKKEAIIISKGKGEFYRKHKNKFIKKIIR